MTTLSAKKNCSSCEKAVTKREKTLICEGCERLLHTACESISSKTYEQLKDNKEISWYCNECKASIKQFRNKTRELEMENKGLRELLSEMKASLKKELKEEIMMELKEHKEERVLQKDIFRTVEDMEEKKKRCENLIIFHLPESSDDNPKKREEDDTGRMGEILKTVLQADDCDITKSIRLGKKNSDTEKPRPLLVKMRTEDQKWKVLKKAKLLRSAADVTIRKLRIAKDQTKAEREISKQRWLEKKSLGRIDSSNNDAPENLDVALRKEKEKEKEEIVQEVIKPQAKNGGKTLSTEEEG